MKPRVAVTATAEYKVHLPRGVRLSTIRLGIDPDCDCEMFAVIVQVDAETEALAVEALSLARYRLSSALEAKA